MWFRRAPTPGIGDITGFADPGVLRGTAAFNVLVWFGSILGKSQGTVEDYELSKRVHVLDDFISHNWSVRRLPKFFALALHYNMVPAVLAAWTLGAMAAALNAVGWLKICIRSDEIRVVNAWIVGQVAFLVVFLFGFELRKLFHLPQHKVFLDKVCIHQTDLELQRQGIESLAGFLSSSQRMVVCYTPIYLRKLWTVYEIASFLTIHQDSSRIVLAPVIWPFCFLAIQFLTTMHRGLILLNVYLGGNTLYLQAVFLFLVLALLSITVRYWAHVICDMEQAVANFSIRHTFCFVEADRKLVQHNVHRFMRFLDRVAPCATEDEALDAFDSLVHEELPGSMRASFGRSTFPYRFIVAATMSYLLFAFDSASESIASGGGVLDALVAVGAHTNDMVVVNPLVVAVLSRLLRCRMDLPRCWEACYTVIAGPLIATFLVVLSWVPVQFLLRVIKDNASEGVMAWVAGAVIWVYVVSCGLAVVSLFRPLPTFYLAMGHLVSGGSLPEPAKPVEKEGAAPVLDSEEQATPVSAWRARCVRAYI